MKKFQKVLNFCVATALIVPNVMVLPQASYAASNSDLSKHWAKDQIAVWTALDLAEGYPDGTFKPDNSITRAEFMALVNRTFNFTAKADITYKDVSTSDWFYADVAKAKATGYIEGYEDGSMKPLETISRQEAAVIVSRIKKLPLAINSKDAMTFVDSAQMADWSKGSIDSVVHAGYMNGYPGELFKPTGLISRAEAIVSLDRAGNVSSETTVLDTTKSFSGQTLPGNVIVASSGVDLKDVIVSGKLVVAEEVGQGDVSLSKVEVKGQTVIKGGGPNSIHLNDSQINQLRVVKPNVRIVATGSTSVEQTEVLSSGKLEESKLSATGTGFTDVGIDSSATVLLAGAFDAIQLKGKSSVDLVEGTISSLNVPSTGQGSTINMAVDTKVDTLTLDGAAQVSGKGNIKQATINVNGVIIETKPTSYTIASNTKATIADQVVDKSTSSEGSNAGNGGNSGNGGNPVEPISTAPTAAQISVVNNPVGTADTVTVQGLSAGDLVTVYGSSAGGTSLGSGQVTTGQTSVTVSIPQLGTDAGQIFVSVKSTGKKESTRTSRDFVAEPAVDPNSRSIASFRAQADNESLTGVIKGTVISAPYTAGTNTNNFYIQDATGGILVFNPVTKTPVVIGDEVEITKGKRLTFNGEAELTEGEFTKTNKNAPIAPTVVNLSDLAANQGKVVTVKNVPVISLTPKFFVGTVSPGNEVYLTRFGVTTSGIVVGDKVDVTGVVSIFSSSPQLLPRTNADITKSSGVSDQDAVLADTAGIIFEDLNAVVSNLELPNVGASGSSITWVSNNPTIVTNAGVVTRPSKGQANGQAVLTATIRKGLVSRTKDFQVTVLPETVSNQEAVANAKTALTLNYSGVENALILPTVGSDGTSVAWALKNSAQSTIVDVSTGTVNRFDIVSDTDVTLVATITKGAVVDTKEITIHVIKGQPMPKVNTVKANQVVVTGTAKAGTTVTVNTGKQAINTAIADSISGTFSVSIPNQPEGTVLEVIASTVGYTSDAAYVLVVNPGSMTDREAVDSAVTALTDNSIKQSNTSLSDVKTSLNLPTSGLNGTTIVWGSTMPSVIGANGSLKRPVFGDLDAVVTLTATISKNGTQSVKTFVVTVKAQTEPLTVVSFDEITASVRQGNAYVLPSKATANMSDGTTIQLDVVWSPTTVDTSVVGTYNYVGATTGFTATAKLTLTVTAVPSALTITEALATAPGTTVTIEGYVQDVEANPSNAGYGIFLDDQIGTNKSTSALIVKFKSADRSGEFSRANAANKKVRITGKINASAYFSQKGFSDTDYSTIEIVSGTGTPAPNAAPTASNVQVAGTATVGQTLTGSYNYADADNDAEGTSTFKWYQVDGSTETAIVGATSKTYVVGQADAGKTLKFEVTPIANGGTTNGTAVKSSATAVVLGNQPPAGTITDLLSTGHTTTTAAFSFTAPTGATVVNLVYSQDGTTWNTAVTNVALNDSSITATATNLTANTSYSFKLIMTGGSFAGESNAVTVMTDVASIPTVLISEGFAAGGTAPANWTFSNSSTIVTFGTYTSSGNYGSSSPSIKLGNSGDSILTPLLTTSATELSFWLKAQGVYTSSLKVEGLVNGNWIIIDTISSLSTTAITKTYKVADSTLAAGIKQIKFTYTKGTNSNLSIDDVVIKG